MSKPINSISNHKELLAALAEDKRIQQAADVYWSYAVDIPEAKVFI